MADPPPNPTSRDGADGAGPKGMTFLDRLLPLWILLAMAARPWVDQNFRWEQC